MPAAQAERLISENISFRATEASTAFVGHSVDTLRQEDNQRREARQTLKHDLLRLSMDVLDKYGVYQTPVNLDSRLENGKKIQAIRRQTAIVPFTNSDGSVIGVSLSDDPDTYVLPPDISKGETHPKEQNGVKGLHLDLHDWQTGEKMGRKSAAFYGTQFAYNAESAQADPEELRGIIDTVSYIDSVLTLSQATGEPSNVQPQ